MDRLRSWLAKPGGARAIGVLVALAGVALLTLGVVALGTDDGRSGAAPAPSATVTSGPPASSTSPSPSGSATSASASPTSSRAGSVPPTRTVAPPPATPTRPATPRAPLTVLNNSTIPGLADRAAAAAQRRGWQIAQVGNFAGRLPATTVYYDPGSAAQQAAAREFAAEFPQVVQVLPRYAGLPPTPAGIVLVVTRDW